MYFNSIDHLRALSASSCRVVRMEWQEHAAEGHLTRSTICNHESSLIYPAAITKCCVILYRYFGDTEGMV